jgi:hypothetical protein
MQVVPLSPVPSQSLSVSLGGQSVSLAIYQLGLAPVADLYLDIVADAVPIVNCRRCRAYSGSAIEAPPFLLLDSLYWGFEGDFLFIDTQGDADPQAAGLGTRWQLVYFAPTDIASIS